MFNPTDIITNGGLILLAIILFAEVGLFLGFFLPGDTLLIAAGILAHNGSATLWQIIVVAAIAAIAGDSFAYYLGRKWGRSVFEKDTFLFRKDHMRKSEAFFEKYGPKTLLVSHFIPVVRTFTPLLAGVGNMPYKKFLIYNVTGDIAWAFSVTLVGYYIGSRIPNADHYILLLVLAATVLTFGPALIHYLRTKYKKRQNTKEIK
jgi:membrane-associated protein